MENGVRKKNNSGEDDELGVLDLPQLMVESIDDLALATN